MLKTIIFTNASNCLNVGAILAQHSLVIPESGQSKILEIYHRHVLEFRMVMIVKHRNDVTK